MRACAEHPSPTGPLSGVMPPLAWLVGLLLTPPPPGLWASWGGLWRAAAGVGSETDPSPPRGSSPSRMWPTRPAPARWETGRRMWTRTWMSRRGRVSRSPPGGRGPPLLTEHSYK